LVDGRALILDQSVRSLNKAKEADAYTYIKESYTDSPDIFFAKGSLKNARQLSNTNPQQEKYAWGKTELMEYKNADGKKLQGLLHYPANYEKGKKYPMITYIYERRTDSKNSYIAPSDRRAYNLTHYVQNGYFVFQPDIVYKTNHPGESAVDCVVPAVEKVLKTGMIDKDKVGLMGHSWGGYQTAFLITQTDLFSAAIAGAPLTNMISMYNSIYWNSGTPDQQIFETSQGRLREPYWNLMEEYIANSPVFQAQNIKHPF
jgi:dipeptidyl aminopeptidase/acylaminoacyl peptidase